MARNQSENLRPKPGVECVILRMETTDRELEAVMLLKWDQERVDLLVNARAHFSQFERIPAVAVLDHISYRDDQLPIFSPDGGFETWLVQDDSRDLTREFATGEILLDEFPDTSLWDEIRIPDKVCMIVEGDRVSWEVHLYAEATYYSENCIRIGERSVFA